MNSREVIAVLERAGWILRRIRGSHHQFSHPSLPGRVTVVHPRRDVPKGTLRSIERQSGLRFGSGGEAGDDIL